MSDIFEEYAELVRRYKAGDETAFGEIYDRSARFVYATCLGVLGDPEDASDAMQETYLAVYKNIDSLADEKKLIGWIKRIAVTKATDLLRKKKGETYYDDALASEEILEGDDDLESLPDYYIVEKTRRDTLHDLIRNALSDVQYQTVLFHYFDEMSVEEIAEVMGCPVGTVKSRLKSSRILIKREVEKYEKENDDKLAAFAGVPFLTGFFNAHAADISIPDIIPFIKEILDSVARTTKEAVETSSSAASKTASSKAASAAVTESSKTGLAGFLATATGKTIALIAVSVVIVSVLIGVTQLFKDDKEKKEEEPTTTTTTEVAEERREEQKEEDGIFDKVGNDISTLERSPAVEVNSDDMPDKELYRTITGWDLVGYDHNDPNEELYHRLFPVNGWKVLNFNYFDPEYSDNRGKDDPRGMFSRSRFMSLETFLWIEREVLNLSEEDIEEFNKLLVPYEEDGVTGGAYIEGDTLWYYDNGRSCEWTWLDRKVLFDGEYYYVENLKYNRGDWYYNPDYYRFEDGLIIFQVLQHKEIDGKGVWSIISTSDDPSTFPGEPAEIPSREEEAEYREFYFSEYGY